MCASVERFDGTVLRTLGDGIMAVFGAPRAKEAHALLACQAALAIQRAFVSDDRDLKIRIGLHSGPTFRRSRVEFLRNFFCNVY